MFSCAQQGCSMIALKRPRNMAMMFINSTRQQPAWSSAAATAVPAEDEEEEVVVDVDLNNKNKKNVLDHFQVLGLPRKFGIDEQTLKESYRRLMGEYHPDRHYQNKDSDFDVEQMASQITQAYQTLKEPHTRASHLLELEGCPLDETSGTDLVGTEFLMQIMELQESVAQTKPPYMKPLWEETQLYKSNVLQKLEQAFDQDHEYCQAGVLSAQLRYWHRIESTIHEKMDLNE